MPNSKAKNQHSATLDDVYEVVTFIKDNVPMRDEVVTKGEFSELKGDFSGLKSEVGELKSEVGELKSEVSGIKATMVTKDYLDDKLADLRGDLVVLTRKEDNKLKTLVGVLHGKRVISDSDVKKIYSMEPFAQ